MKMRIFVAVLGAGALAVPAAAAADPGHGNGHEKGATDVVNAKSKARSTSRAQGKRTTKKAKKVMFIFKGKFTATGAVMVLSGNSRVRKGGYAGRTVTFDFANAKVIARDTNADGKVDLNDVKDGSLVLVQARIVRGTKYVAPAVGETAKAVAARKLIDTTSAAVDGDEPAPAVTPAA